MAAQVGRKVTFTPEVGGAAVIGARTKSITLNNESIDITTDDDTGFRTLLGEDPAMRSLDLSIEGVLKDAALIELAMSGSMLIAGYTLDIPGIGEFVGDFYFGSVEIGASYNEAVTFSATVQSSGSFTFTADA
jgi:TP901-1 family phage major tail protein